MKKFIKEGFDSDRLYEREYIVRILKSGPKELKHYIKSLPHIDCENSEGRRSICTRIPEVIYTYMVGIY
jgi:hypothetical protein